MKIKGFFRSQRFFSTVGRIDFMAGDENSAKRGKVQKRRRFRGMTELLSNL